MRFHVIALSCLMLVSLPISSAEIPQPAVSSRQATSFAPGELPSFTFDELITLSKDEPLPPVLENKLSTVLHSVVIDNSAPAPSPSASPLRVKKIGPALRIAEWNIERGERFDWVLLALQDAAKFRAQVQKENSGLAAKLLNTITEQANILEQADVLILNEVDLGMTRSGYHDVARDLASALKMNFVYGAEFVEVDPLKLGTETLTDEDAGGDHELQQELEADLKADPAHYKGLHGSAILSRYPIANVRMQRLPVCHDWFNGEIADVAKVEQGKRLASDKIFLEKIEREIRRGGRMAITADLKISDVPGGTVTVVDTHLENKCKPECRQKQMQALLEGIQDVQNPVIMAGDMNTTGSDASNLSLTYILKSKATDYRFWGRQALMMSTPLPSLFMLNYFKNYTDPTARDIKFLGDNKEAALFNNIEKFHFADGGRFDFRGNRSRTVNGTRKRLANSNQRAKKGFVYTFSLPRDFKGIVGRYRLDWLFIKPVYKDSKRTEILAPWYARTLLDLNNAPNDRISDHAPITVDLPLTAQH